MIRFHQTITTDLELNSAEDDSKKHGSWGRCEHLIFVDEVPKMEIHTCLWLVGMFLFVWCMPCGILVWLFFGTCCHAGNDPVLKSSVHCTKNKVKGNILTLEQKESYKHGPKTNKCRLLFRLCKFQSLRTSCEKGCSLDWWIENP